MRVASFGVQTHRVHSLGFYVIKGLGFEVYGLGFGVKALGEPHGKETWHKLRKAAVNPHLTISQEKSVLGDVLGG